MCTSDAFPSWSKSAYENHSNQCGCCAGTVGKLDGCCWTLCRSGDINHNCSLTAFPNGHVTHQHLHFVLNCCCPSSMPSLWKVESKVGVDFGRIIPALCADVHQAKAYLSYIFFFSLHSSFLLSRKKSRSEFSDTLHMKGAFRRLLRLFRWVCFPPHFNVYEQKKKKKNLKERWLMGERRETVFVSLTSR